MMMMARSAFLLSRFHNFLGNVPASRCNVTYLLQPCNECPLCLLSSFAAGSPEIRMITEQNELRAATGGVNLANARALSL